MSPSPTVRRSSRPAASPAGKGKRPPARGRPAAPAPRKRRFPLALVAGIALAAGLIVVMVLSMKASGDDDAPLEVGTPTVTGEALATFTPGIADPAVGLPIPEVTGEDFSGTAVRIARDGRAKAILFVAHWCSVCRREVPLIAGWLPGADLPDDVDLYTVSTGVDRSQPNYPPSAWFADEGWSLPVLMDGKERSVARAFGLSAYPYWVFVSADGRVGERAQGLMPTEDLEQRLADLAAG